MANIEWDSKNYESNFSFVSKYGEDVIDLIETKSPAKIIDAGCGNGILTKKLVERGYDVLGVDSSKDMLELFKKNNPGQEFLETSLLNLRVPEEYDVIFSNACFHWIERKDQHQLAIRLNKALKLNGELVFEFGGYKCANLVHHTLERIFNEHGLIYRNDFYFPTIREHSNVLEDHGFLVKYAILFDRPTKQEKGLRGWIEMFNKTPFNITTIDLKEEIIEEAEQRLKDKLYHDGSWYIDYTRIRMRAVKIKNV